MKPTILLSYLALFVSIIPLPPADAADLRPRSYTVAPIHLPVTREMVKVNHSKSGRISRRYRDLNQHQYSTNTAGLIDGLDVGVSVMTGPSFESAFYISIGIGTPAQEAVKIKLDTGSYELVAGYSESAIKSSTYSTENEPFKEFGWTGIRAMDTITFGGLVVKNQTFSQATNDVTWGLMGLSCINNDRQDLLLPNMYRQGLIPQPVFGLYLNTDWRNDNTSVITLGGVDRSHFDGPLVWVPVVNDEWKVNLTLITVKSKTGGVIIDTSDCVAVFDTGSPHMQMHRAFLPVIAETLGAVLVNETIDENPYTSVGDYKVDCAMMNSTENDITFFFGGLLNLTMKPSDYIVIDKNECYLNFRYVGFYQPENPDPRGTPCEFMFGLAFMEYFYMAYDFRNGRIDFAPVFPHPISYRGNSFQTINSFNTT